MKHPNVLKAVEGDPALLMIEGRSVNRDGFLVTEAQLNKIEAALGSNNNSTVDQVNALKNENQSLKAKLQTANQTIAQLRTTIKSLNTKVNNQSNNNEIDVNDLEFQKRIYQNL